MKFHKNLQAALAFAAVLFGALPGAAAQEASMKQLLTGTWLLVSATGNSVAVGNYPKGIVMFDAIGNFALQLSSAELAPFALPDRGTGTPYENRAVMKGNLAYFGTYAAQGADKSLALHITVSSYPNLNNSDQKWKIDLSGTNLTLSAAPGDATLTFIRSAPTIDFGGGGR